MAQRSAPVLSFPVPSGTLSLDDPSLYVNRELSLLQFQWRVLEEARDPANPLLERVKFLAIVGSNLDEFFMVRVAGLKNQVDAGIYETGADGMSAVAQLRAIRQEYHRLSESAHECRRRIFAELAEQGIRVLQYGELAPEQKFQVDQYFAETIYPVLTPLAVDPGRPFPHISNLSLNIAVLIRDEDGDIRFARLKVPDSLPQLMPLQNRAKPANRVRDFVWLEQVIQANLPSLFPGMEIEESHMFHVTRDADLDIQELEADDLLETIEQGVRQRRFGAVVRLEVNAEMPESIVEILEKNLGIDEAD
ncbi:MAG: RNA degradosome polyphosphate kinase, partial [Bryobacteraceae bacterium]